jgi:hypothetical protein
MKQIAIFMLFFSFTAQAQQNYDSLVSPNCSCDTVAYWKAYYEAQTTRNKILKDSIDYWYKAYLRSESSRYQSSRYNSDSLWYNGKYVARKRYNNQQFDVYFLFGIAYNYYKPKAVDSLGSFNGISFEPVLYGVGDQNDHSGPSHIRIYGRLCLQTSSKHDIGQLFWYGLGFNLSFEKNPHRNFLIPYYGIEAGGVRNKQIGSSLGLTPMVGIHVIAKRNLYINLQIAQPYTLKNFDMLQGYMLQGTVNFSWW